MTLPDEVVKEINHLDWRFTDHAKVERIALLTQQLTRRLTIEEAAKVAAQMWPRGGAHTYASENADRYIALENASEHIAARIRQLEGK